MLTACKTYRTVVLKHSTFCTYFAKSKLNPKLLSSHPKTLPCREKQKAKTGGPRWALGGPWRRVWDTNHCGLTSDHQSEKTDGHRQCRPNQQPSWKTFMAPVLPLAPPAQPPLKGIWLQWLAATLKSKGIVEHCRWENLVLVRWLNIPGLLLLLGCPVFARDGPLQTVGQQCRATTWRCSLAYSWGVWTCCFPRGTWGP